MKPSPDVGKAPPDAADGHPGTSRCELGSGEVSLLTQLAHMYEPRTVNPSGSDRGPAATYDEVARQYRVWAGAPV